MTSAKKTTYGIVIGLGLCGFLADRLLSSGAPATPAPAAAAETRLPPAPDGSPQGDLAGLSAIAVMPFPKGFPPLADPAASRDPFEVSAAVLEKLMPPAPAAEGSAGAEADVPSLAEAFQANHRLSAVLRVGASRIAVLDGKAMMEGQTLDGCELSHIAAREARFECADGEVTLTLQSPLEQTSGNQTGR